MKVPAVVINKLNEGYRVFATNDNTNERVRLAIAEDGTLGYSEDGYASRWAYISFPVTNFTCNGKTIA